MSQIFDFHALDSATVHHEPYTYMIVPGFIGRDCLDPILSSFPRLPGPGSHLVDNVNLSPSLTGIIDALRGGDFRRAIGRKFNLDLEGCPTLCTLRGQTTLRDGQIHTDSPSKIVTVLVYLNADWSTPDGRLRILRSATDIEDYAAEIDPVGGTMLAFVRSDRSWHGHKPFAGPRNAIQFNWTTGKGFRLRETFRHGLSHAVKHLVGSMPGHRTQMHSA